ncbi:MAG: hypothetical protein RLN62_05635 [Rickettsiales bacterium]
MSSGEKQGINFAGDAPKPIDEQELTKPHMQTALRLAGIAVRNFLWEEDEEMLRDEDMPDKEDLDETHEAERVEESFNEGVGDGLTEAGDVTAEQEENLFGWLGSVLGGFMHDSDEEGGEEGAEEDSEGSGVVRVEVVVEEDDDEADPEGVELRVEDSDLDLTHGQAWEMALVAALAGADPVKVFSP